MSNNTTVPQVQAQAPLPSREKEKFIMTAVPMNKIHAANTKIYLAPYTRFSKPFCPFDYKILLQVRKNKTH
jgi:hypothetical protein